MVGPKLMYAERSHAIYTYSVELSNGGLLDGKIWANMPT